MVCVLSESDCFERTIDCVMIQALECNGWIAFNWMQKWVKSRTDLDSS
jgi:hypothetical protein